MTTAKYKTGGDILIVEFKDIHGNKRTYNTESNGSFAYNADCMDFLRACPDNAFDLCVCDPPYGIKNDSHATDRIKRYGQLQTANSAKPT
ncbi:MAG: site-specific DNA-methyltransferase, partial [Bacteroidales bacterium]|nr:site-specific DNA-methyltransferase [Bacteroidales bacterium]